jgi:pyruvate formate lyase activating enzyme
LLEAYDIARQAGIRYIYTGNVIDQERQHTYCPGCRRAVIERSGYDILSFAIQAGRCMFCQAPIAGRFADVPGTWGSRRLPVRIANYS